MRFTHLLLPLIVACAAALPARFSRDDLAPAGHGLATRAADVAAPRSFLDGSSVGQALEARAVHKRDLPGASVTPSSNGNTIKSLQWLLTARGHAAEADGAFGPATVAAIKAFQSASKLTVDGQAGPATLGALVSTVQSGSSGNFAKAAQAALNGKGASLAIDGQFGAASKTATVAFQSANGLTADGIVGPDTWAKLFGGTGGNGGGGGGDCSSVTSGVSLSGTVLLSGGIRVHACFAPTISKLIAAAAADGITLSANSAWRSPDEQIKLRQQNCGTSHYAIYEMPSGQCSPPTAIPGSSRHERGLAIDFANCAKGSTVFNWLSRNGANYHLYNLPSESWHWSWDGK